MKRSAVRLVGAAVRGGGGGRLFVGPRWRGRGCRLWRRGMWRGAGGGRLAFGDLGWLLVGLGTAGKKSSVLGRGLLRGLEARCPQESVANIVWQDWRRRNRKTRGSTEALLVVGSV
jgi:hypothetical protein